MSIKTCLKVSCFYIIVFKIIYNLTFEPQALESIDVVIYALFYGSYQ